MNDFAGQSNTEPCRMDHLRAARVTKNNLGVIGPLAHRDPATSNLIAEGILDTQIVMAEASRIVALAAVLDLQANNGGIFRDQEEHAAVQNELRDLLGFIEIEHVEDTRTVRERFEDALKGEVK